MAAETKSGRSRAALFLDFFMITMQKNNSVTEVEYIGKSENVPLTDGTEQQCRKSDLQLRPIATHHSPPNVSFLLFCDLIHLKYGFQNLFPSK